MGKRENGGSALSALAHNLARLLDAKGIKSEPALAKLSGVSQKSINNILNERHDPYLSTIEKLAKKLGIESFQLLCQERDDKFLAVCQAWAQSDDRGRDDLHAIAEAILRRKDRGADKEGGPISSANTR